MKELVFLTKQIKRSFQFALCIIIGKDKPYPVKLS